MMLHRSHFETHKAIVSPNFGLFGTAEYAAPVMFGRTQQ
jgi:hypothetical protein